MRQRVLIVDDNEDLEAMIAKALHDFDHLHVDVAFSDEEALIRARTYPYDLYVLDLHLIGTTGLRLAQLILDFDPLANIIFYSGYTGSDIKAIAESMGIEIWNKNEIREVQLLAEINEKLQELEP